MPSIALCDTPACELPDRADQIDELGRWDWRAIEEMSRRRWQKQPAAFPADARTGARSAAASPNCAATLAGSAADRLLMTKSALRWRRPDGHGNTAAMDAIDKSPIEAAASADPAFKAAVLAQAMPYLRQYAGETIVVKYGGHAMGAGGDDLFPRHRAAEAGRHPSDRGAWRRAADQPDARPARRQERSFVNGLRVTDNETMEVVEMVLAGTINKQMVGAINAAGGRAIGLSGKDGMVIAG